MLRAPVTTGIPVLVSFQNRFRIGSNGTSFSRHISRDPALFRPNYAHDYLPGTASFEISGISGEGRLLESDGIRVGSIRDPIFTFLPGTLDYLTGYNHVQRGRGAGLTQRDPIRPPPAPTRQGSSGLSSPLYKYAHHARIISTGKLRPPLNPSYRSRAAFQHLSERCFTNCRLNIKETRILPTMYIYIYIFTNKSQASSSFERNSQFRYILDTSIVSGRKKFVFQRKGFSLICLGV